MAKARRPAYNASPIKVMGDMLDGKPVSVRRRVAAVRTCAVMCMDLTAAGAPLGAADYSRRAFTIATDFREHRNGGACQ